jgi:hypothetical protein
VKSQTSGESKIADAVPDGLEHAQAIAGPDSGTRHGGQPNESLDACIEELRKVYASGPEMVVRTAQDRLRRRLGLAPEGAAAGVLFGLTGVGFRLALVVVATAVAGEWAGVPWGRWAAILLFYGLLDFGWTFFVPSSESQRPPVYMRAVEEWTVLFRTIVRKSDLEDLTRFTRRVQRLPATDIAGATVAATMLCACWVVSPAALRELPPGSLVLLSLLLFDFGGLPIWNNTVLNWVTMAREARYEHRLFWPSPADSPEVRNAMGRTVFQASLAGMWTTVFLILTLVLVSWGSPLTVPLAVGFISIGYVTTIGLTFSNRASVRKIIERSRNQRLSMLRTEIETFESSFVHLSPEESEHLRDLMFLHDKVRDAPTAPTHSRTLLRTAAALVPPTIAFVITVFGEVSAERFLEAILP